MDAVCVMAVLIFITFSFGSVRRIPAALDFPAFQIFSTNYPAYKMFMLAVSVVIFVARSGLPMLR